VLPNVLFCGLFVASNPKFYFVKELEKELLDLEFLFESLLLNE
jgi:hypothetical protein